VTTASSVQELTHEEFYTELVTRNRGLIPEQDQARLRAASILVAGCGSVGGAAIEPLARLGAEHLVLADPGDYELANLNRQRATVDDLFRNKARTHADRIGRINPHAQVEVVPVGLTEDNLAGLVDGADVVIDGVDVTIVDAVRLKVGLHLAASRAGVPVVCGYDVAGVQALLVYDYRVSGTVPLGGKIKPAEAATITPLEFMARVVPTAALPLEIVPEVLRQVSGTSEGFPQLVYTADLFGVLAARAVLELLAGRPVRRRTIVDIHQLLRPSGARRQVRLARIVALVKLARVLARAKKGAAR
jgi:tRNA threonylcarbamoyladenosine dehydratase